MHYLANLVDKEHYPFLEDLSRICESSDVAETKDGYAFLTGQQWVYVVTLTHVLSDDLGPGLTETYGKQSTNLIECILENLGLHRRILLHLPLLALCLC